MYIRAATPGQQHQGSNTRAATPGQQHQGSNTRAATPGDLPHEPTHACRYEITHNVCGGACRFRSTTPASPTCSRGCPEGAARGSGHAAAACRRCTLQRRRSGSPATCTSSERDKGEHSLRSSRGERRKTWHPEGTRASLTLSDDPSLERRRDFPDASMDTHSLY